MNFEYCHRVNIKPLTDSHINRKALAIFALACLLAGVGGAQTDKSEPSHLAPVTSLHFVPPYQPPQQPDWLAIEKANKARVAAQESAQAAQQAQEAQRAAEQQQAAYTAPTPVISQPSDDPKLFIYSHESGNNPAAINPYSGACGLGQALPCSKLPCSLSDYACQDAWFTQYAISRYGSWAAAEAFWIANGWW